MRSMKLTVVVKCPLLPRTQEPEFAGQELNAGTVVLPKFFFLLSSLIFSVIFDCSFIKK
jgi:hypothetical protein